MLRTIIHALGVAHFTYALWLGPTNIHAPSDMSVVTRSPGAASTLSDFNGQFKTDQLKYLTVWNLVLQAFYFGLCIINDVIGSNDINPKNKPIIRTVKDFVLATLAFPIAMFVGVTFWSLMAIDRELVFPKILDLYFPTWLNHVMHTNIMIFTIMEVITSFRLYPKRSNGVKALLLFMVIYLGWTHVIFYNSGKWVYPICDLLNWWQRNIFFASMCAFAVALYFVGESLNNSVWAKEVKQLEGSKKSLKKGN